MTKKPITTFDKWMKNPTIKMAYENGYEEFVLSELIKALMENDHKSVRGLAKKAGLSPTVIQDIRSGKQEDMKVKNFISVAHACGYHLFLVNEREKILVGE